MVATSNSLLEPITDLLTVAEYLEIEIQTGERYQFFNGLIKQMAGSSIEHNRISRNILSALDASLDVMYESFGSDQKIYLPKYNFYVYPDAVVVCDAPIITNKGQAILNPILIVEVLSNSTEEYDNGQKFLQYQSIPTFKEYMFVRQDTAEVTTFFREESDLWRSKEVLGLENSVLLKSVQLSLAMDKIYKKVNIVV
jgi:Uma2 family endonuclease